jgi:hypothetical protein
MSDHVDDSAYDSDEWVDSEDMIMPQSSSSSSSSSSARQEDVYTAKIPKITEIGKIPKTLELLNLVSDGKRYDLYRCEPALKKYPGVHSEDIKQFRTWLFQIRLCNSAPNGDGSQSYVPMRLPDFKSKGLNFIRRNQTPELKDAHGRVVDNSSVFVTNGVPDTIYFKKKCVDNETKRDIAFELGKGYLSHTRAIDPKFCIIAIPFANGAFVMEKAIRTPDFHVFSKRQTRHTARANKKRKISSVVAQYDTNISEAEIVLRSLRTEYEKLRCLNRKYEVKIGTVRRRAAQLPDGPVKIAIEYATKNIEQTSDTVEI